MTIEQFIEKAIEGGYSETLWSKDDLPDWGKLNSSTVYRILVELVVNPKAWQGVGKVEGWEAEVRDIPVSSLHRIYYKNGNHALGLQMRSSGWFYNMHRMIDALAEDKSIEDFIKSL